MSRREKWEPVHYASVQARERKRRWSAKGRAVVSHPEYGSVIVPHQSDYSAILNAAEFWGVPWIDVIRSTVQWASQDTEAVQMPMQTGFRGMYGR